MDEKAKFSALQQEAEDYSELLNDARFVKFLKSIKTFEQSCIDKILTGLKTFDEYKYWLGRYHSSKEIEAFPKLVINEEKKQREFLRKEEEGED